jgi:hypothetical protein
MQHVVFVYLALMTQAAKSEEKQERSNIIETYNLLSYMSNCQ